MTLVVDLSAAILKKPDAKGRAHRVFSIYARTLVRTGSGSDWALTSVNSTTQSLPLPVLASFHDHFAHLCRKRWCMKRYSIFDRPFYAAGLDDLSISDLFDAGRV